MTSSSRYGVSHMRSPTKLHNRVIQSTTHPTMVPAESIEKAIQVLDILLSALSKKWEHAEDAVVKESYAKKIDSALDERSRLMKRRDVARRVLTPRRVP